MFIGFILTPISPHSVLPYITPYMRRMCYAEDHSNRVQELMETNLAIYISLFYTGMKSIAFCLWSGKNLYFADDSKNSLYLQKPSVFFKTQFFMPFLIWILKMYLPPLDEGDVYLKNTLFSLKHLKIKYLCHSIGGNSAAMIRIELPSVSNIVLTVALFHSFINWAFWFPWKPNCRHGLLRSSLCCTKHKELWVCCWVTSFLAAAKAPTGGGNLSTCASEASILVFSWRIRMDFPGLSYPDSYA